MNNPEVWEETNYINDKNQDYTQVLMTKDSQQNYRAAYTYGVDERIGVEDLIKVEGKPNNPLYYLHDALGSTIAITNMNAEIIDTNRFAPYGEALDPVAKNTRLTNSPFGYTGEMHDVESDLVYLRARMYEPNTMRFIQQDTYLGQIEDPMSRHLYMYGKNNPLTYVDPSGHSVANDDVGGGWVGSSPMHRAVQIHVKMKIFGGAANIEVPIKGSSINGGTGRADIVFNTFIWEVKPAKPWYMNGSGEEQLQRYINNMPGEPGFDLGTFIVPYGDKELVVQSYGQPGMLYYYPRKKQQEKQTQESNAYSYDKTLENTESYIEEATGWAIAGTILYWAISELSRVFFPPRNLIPIL